MMTYKEIQEIIKLLNKSNELAEFKLKNGDFELSIRTKNYMRSKQVETTASPSILPIQTSSPSFAPVPAPVPTAAPAPKAEPAPTATPAASQKDESKYVAVKSPIVGTFYRSPSPEKPPYAKVGDKIEVGSVVCIVEAMKLFNDIESEVSGTIVKVMVEDAQPVQYDQVLFLVDPN